MSITSSQNATHSHGCGITRLVAFLSLTLPAHAQINLPMSAHWGASMFPTLAEGTQAGLTTMNFTQFDGQGRQYGAYERDSALVRQGLLHPDIHYDETVGPVLMLLGRSGVVGGKDAALNNLYYGVTFGLGASWDPLPKFLQNRVLHLGYRDLPIVQRGQVRCEEDFTWQCVDYTMTGELNYRYPNITQNHDLRIKPSPLFFGIGGAVSSIGTELYAQAGAKEIKVLPRLFNDWTILRVQVLSPRVNAMTRMGLLWNEGLTQTFRALNPGYIINQAGADLVFLPKKYPISIKNLVTAHSGIFLDTRNQPIRELFWSLRISMGDFHFEQANDLINGKDAGPTFLAGISVDIPHDWWISRKFEWFCGGILSEWD